MDTLTFDTDSLRQASEQSQVLFQQIATSAETQAGRIDAAFAAAANRAVATQSAVGVVQQMAAIQAQCKQTQKALGDLLQSKELANELVAQTVDLAAKSPFQLSELNDGVQQLIAYGIAGDRSIETLRRLGDVALGTEQPLSHLVDLYGSAAALGGLSETDLGSFTGAGIPMLEQLATLYGQTTDQIQQMAAAGTIGFEQVRAALEAMTNQAGIFFGLMEEQSSVIEGQIEQLRVAIQELFNGLAKQQLPQPAAAAPAAPAAAPVETQGYETLLNLIGGISKANDLYKTGLMLVSAAERVRYQLTLASMQGLSSMQAITMMLTDKLRLLGATIKTHPYIALAAGAVLLATAIYKIIAAKGDEQAAFERVNASIDTYAKKESQLQASAKGFKGVIDDQVSTAYEKQKAYESLVEAYPELLKKYSEEQIKLKSSIELERELNAISQQRKKNNLQNQYDDAEAQVQAISAQLKEVAKYDTNGGATFAISLKLKEAEAELKVWRDQLESYRKTEAAAAPIEVKIATLQENLAKLEEERKRIDELLAVPESPTLSLLAPASGKPATPAPPSTFLMGQKQQNDQKIEETKTGIEDYKLLQQSASGWDQLRIATDDYYAKNAIWAANKRKNASLDTIASSKQDADGAKQRLQKIEAALGIDTSARKQAAEKQAQLQQQIAAAEQKNLEAAEQAKIDLLAKGQEKSLAQIELNRKRKQEALSKERDTALQNNGGTLSTAQEEAFAARKKAIEVEAANSTTAIAEESAAQVKALYTQIADAALDEEQRKQNAIQKSFDKQRAELLALKNSGTITEVEYKIKISEVGANEQGEAIENLLSGIQTYEQQRAAIEEKFSTKKAPLYEKDGKTLKQGVTQGNVDELDRQRDDALFAVDDQFAQRQESYQLWLQTIAGLSLTELRGALDAAKEELKKAEGSGDPKKLAPARAKVAEATNAVKGAEAKVGDKSAKMTSKDWEEVCTTISGACDEFDKLGAAIGGTAGEAIQTAGAIASTATSMVSNIVKFTTTSISAVSGAETAALATMKAIEAASVILAIIGAVVQIATLVAGLFNNDKFRQEEIDKLQGRIDQLQWELDNAQIKRLKDNGVDSVVAMRQAYAAVSTEVLGLHQNEANALRATAFFSEKEIEQLVKRRHQTEILGESANRLADYYTKVSYSADKALGGAKYTEAQNNLKNISQQQLLMQQQIDQEGGKKKSDPKKIADWERQIAELGADAIAMINTMVEGIIGGSAEEIAGELGGAFFDAFRSGEDAAEAWSNKVKDIVADIMKRMLIQKYLEEPMGKLFDKYKDKWFANGEFSIDNVTGSMTDFSNEMLQIGDLFGVMIEELPENLLQSFAPEDPKRDAAARGGIATASQESVDENNGRLTAIQGHTASLSESVRSLLITNERALEYLAGIREHTANLFKLEAIRKDILLMRVTINEFNTKGIRIR